jgi:hypothetical protein
MWYCSTTVSESIYPPIEVERSEHADRSSQYVYDFLVEEVRSSQHGRRFTLRNFTLADTNGYPSPLSIDRPYCEPVESTEEHRLWLANLAGNLVMPHKNYLALVQAMQRTYERKDVSDHLAGGGTIKWLDSHFTYVGQVMEQIASWHALQQIGHESPEQMQTTIVSRITSLFQLGILATICAGEDRPHRGGMIFEDVLLQFGGGLQTLPRSSSGNRLVDALKGGLQIRKAANEKTRLAYERIVNRGSQIIFEGPSGTENKLDEHGTHRLISEVSERTTELVTKFNDQEGAERILCIPIFMESNPFTGNPDLPFEARPTPFAILAPRFITTEREYHATMRELADAGTLYKKSGTPPFKYDKLMSPSRQTPNAIEAYTA